MIENNGIPEGEQTAIDEVMKKAADAAAEPAADAAGTAPHALPDQAAIAR